MKSVDRQSQVATRLLRICQQRCTASVLVPHDSLLAMTPFEGRWPKAG